MSLSPRVTGHMIRSLPNDTSDSDQENEPSPAVRPTHITAQDEQEKAAKIEEIIMIEPECLELDLNHGRVGKIEGLERLVCIERYINAC